MGRTSVTRFPESHDRWMSSPFPNEASLVPALRPLSDLRPPRLPQRHLHGGKSRTNRSPA